MSGGFRAAARYAPTVRYNKVSIYVEPQDVDEFMEVAVVPSDAFFVKA